MVGTIATAALSQMIVEFDQKLRYVSIMFRSRRIYIRSFGPPTQTEGLDRFTIFLFGLF